MAEKTPSVPDILKLARYEGAADRVNIFCRLFGLLVDNKVDPGAPVYPVLFQMMDVLWPEIATPVRRELAKRIAAAPNPPAGLALRFAIDEPEVAAPVLADPRLGDDFLIGVIKRTGRTHHLLIAERPDLSEAIWDEIRYRRHQDESTGDESAADDSAEASPTRKRESFSIFSLKMGKAGHPKGRIRNEPDDFAKEPVPLVESLISTELDRLRPEDKGKKGETKEFEPEQARWGWRTDRSGALIEIDGGCARAFAMGREQLIGKNFFALIEDASSTGSVLEASIDKRTPLRHLPIRIVDNFGKESNWVLNAKAQFERNSGRFQGYVGEVQLTSPRKLRSAS